MSYMSQFHQPLPPDPRSFHTTVTYRPRSHPSLPSFSPSVSSSNHYPQPSLSTSQNASSSPPLPNPPNVSDDLNASLNPHFHNYRQLSYPPPLPPNFLPTSTYVYMFFAPSSTCLSNDSFRLLPSQTPKKNILIAWIIRILLKSS